MTRLERPADFTQFLKALTRTGRPSHLPFYEHLASSGFIARRTETPFDRMTMDDEGYWRIYVDFWLGMGYDCIPMEIPPRLPLPSGQGGLSEESEAHVVIRSWEDFQRYPWPDPADPFEFRHFETVAALLPEGVKIVGGVGAGPYEWASRMLGTLGMAYLLADDPPLVEAVFRKLDALYVGAARRLAALDAVGALRQGDDLGFKTSTFLPPALLRTLVFPTYRSVARISHGANKPFILHSCGNLAEVYGDLIDDCRIDAKHSFEDVILPVEEFQRIYGARVTPLGGLDVDFLCQRSPAEIKAYARRKIERCFESGHWALGTGNSLTNYLPVENYMAALEVGLSVR